MGPNSIILSPDEINWLQANYPDLEINVKHQCISGELAFRMFYPENPSEAYVINPDKSYEGMNGTLLEDVYEIDIRLKDRQALPEVREVGGRITESLLKWNIKDPADLHIYSSGNLCLCVVTEIDKHFPDGFNLEDFFFNLLIPFLFYQSYFEQFGKEPWPSYGHGDMGILESFQNRIELGDHLSDELVCSYLENLSEKLWQRILTNTEIKGHHKCLCGSKKIVRKCHKKAMYGYNSLRHYHKMDPRRQVDHSKPTPLSFRETND